MVCLITQFFCNQLIHKSLLVCRIVNEIFQVIESNSNMFPPKSNMDCESKQMWDMNNEDPSTMQNLDWSTKGATPKQWRFN